MNLSCADIVRYDDRFFILTKDTQYLFEYHYKTGKINLCGTVRSKLAQSFVSMTLCGDKIYFAPYETEIFCIYDIKRRKFQRISLGKIKGKAKWKYYKICFSYQEKIYFLGGKGTSMLCIDTKTNEIEEIAEWSNSFKNKFGFETWIRTHQHICITEHCFWVALEGNNMLLQYNMITNEYCFWNIGIKKMQYVTVSFDGEYFWISGEKKVIVRWKKETNEIKEFEDFPKGFIVGDGKIGWKELFSCGYVWNGNIYFAPLNSNMLIKFEREYNQMKCIIKTDLNHVCFKMIEISPYKLYMEEDRIDTFLFDRAYFIDMNDEYKRTSFYVGKKEVLYGNFMIEDIKMENNVMVEGFPQCILKMCYMLCGEKILDNYNQNYVGRNIWKYL